MTRSSAREIAVQILYAYTLVSAPLEELMEEWLSSPFYARLAGVDPLYENPPGQEESAYIHRLVSGVAAHMPEIDHYIEKYAIGWEFNRIPLTASCVMRVAMFEILYMPDIPNGAAINEAVEISKHYDIPEVAAFVNGILGSFVRAEFPE